MQNLFFLLGARNHKTLKLCGYTYVYVENGADTGLTSSRSGDVDDRAVTAGKTVGDLQLLMRGDPVPYVGRVLISKEGWGRGEEYD